MKKMTNKQNCFIDCFQSDEYFILKFFCILILKRKKGEVFLFKSVNWILREKNKDFFLISVCLLYGNREINYYDGIKSNVFCQYHITS